MAHFRGTIEGNRGDTSRLGTKKTGLIVTANGWKAGVQVEVRHDKEKNSDVFEIYKTTGGDCAIVKELIGSFRVKA